MGFRQSPVRLGIEGLERGSFLEIAKRGTVVAARPTRAGQAERCLIEELSGDGIPRVELAGALER
jgi:hypothetical protein